MTEQQTRVIPDSRYGSLTIFAHDTGAGTTSLVTYGEWAENEVSFLKQFVTSGSTVLDVGAYIGTHTLSFARFVGPRGRVIAIEAQPDTYEVLSKNVSANAAKGVVELRHAIASCQLGEIAIPTLDVERESSYGSTSLLETLTQTRHEATRQEVITRDEAAVRTITIDSLQLQTCALIKVDVEGMEDMVLCGAVQALARCSPVVYCECNALAGGLKSLALLKVAQYKVFAHVVNAFNPDNYFRVEENIFNGARELALVGVPAERETYIRSLPLRPFELLLDISEADDLALALLNKPQYQFEVLRLSKAAKTGGGEFLDHFEASKIESERLRRENAQLHRIRAEERQSLEDRIRAVYEQHSALTQEKSEEIAQLHVLLTRRDVEVRLLQEQMSERDRDISELHSRLTQQDAAVTAFQSEVRQQITQRARKESELAVKNEEVARLHASRSWKLTTPLRWTRERLQHLGRSSYNAKKFMKALEILAEQNAFEHEVNYTKTVALTYQPESYSNFNRHPEFDEIFRRWTQNDKNRGLDFVRIWSLALNCKNALEVSEGSVAELGVYQGQSAALLSFYAELSSRKIFLCDTFSGFAEQQFEEGMSDGKKAAFKDISLEAAQAVVGNYSEIRWVVGTFPASITPEMREEKYAFVSIDCDIYEPVRQGLQFFWPRMQPGGLIFTHDYSSGHWPGAKRAMDEFCAENGVAGCLLPDLAGTYILARGRI